MHQVTMTRWYRVVLGCFVLAGALASFFLPSAPLLAFWLCCALGFGGYLAFNNSVPGLPERTLRVALLYALLLPVSLVTTQVSAARRSSAEHLRVHGVFVERGDTILIGSGTRGADVALPMSSPDGSPWFLRMTRAGTAWTISPDSRVEQLRLSPDRRVTPSRWQPLASLLHLQSRNFVVPFGAVLSDETSRAEVRDRAGHAVDTLSLAVTESGPVVQSRRLGAFHLAPVAPRLTGRFRRMLGAGTSLAALDESVSNQRAQVLPLARLVRVQEIQRRQQFNQAAVAPASTFAWPATSTRRFLLTGVWPYSVAPLPAPRDSTAILLGDSTRIEVRHGGGLWRFDVVRMQRARSGPAGISVRYVRTPKVLDFPLPMAGTCPASTACGLLSLRPLPPPVAHIALVDAGPDTGRFALLATARESRDGLVIGLPQQEITVRRSAGLSLLPVATRSIRDDGVKVATIGAPTHWLMVSASASRFNTVWRMALVGAGVVILLLVVHQLVGTASAGTVRAHSSNESALTLGLNALLALIMTRLIIGARVALFTPYNDAGLDSAVGLVVAIAIVSFGLLMWPLWVPRLLTWMATGRARSDARAASDSSTGTLRADTPLRSRRKRGRYLRLVGSLVLALALLVWAAGPVAVGMGMLTGVAVVSVWLLLAAVSALSGTRFNAFTSGPSGVIELDDDEAANGASVSPESSPAAPPPVATATAARPWQQTFGPNAQIAWLCIVWALTLKMPIAGIVVALVCAAVAVAMQLRQRRGGSTLTNRRVLLNIALQFLSVFLLAVLRLGSENGAMPAFLLVILVTLISVRFGRALAGRIARGHRRSVEWPVIALYLSLPVVLLGLSLAAIDMGLLLVTVIPIGAASLLAVGWRTIGRGGKVFAGVLAFVVAWMLVTKVLFPRIGAIGNPDASLADRASAFEGMQRVAGMRVPEMLGEINSSLARAAARAVATANQGAAERLLLAAKPGVARDLLAPSIEQAWGGRVYSASGFVGHGLGTAPVGGHGIAEAVSYAENSFAVYVLFEHGALGGVMLLLTYLTLMVAVMIAMHDATGARHRSAPDSSSLRASRALFLIAALLVTIPAAYVALSNLGIVPITGQNMPFLGLNSWSDVTLCAGVVGMLLTGAIRTQAMQRTVA